MGLRQIGSVLVLLYAVLPAHGQEPRSDIAAEESEGPPAFLVDQTTTFLMQRERRSGLPAERVYFGGDYALANGVWCRPQTSKDHDETKVVFPLCFQLITPKTKTLLKTYAGVPFRLEELKSDSLQLDSKIELHIVHQLGIHPGKHLAPPGGIDAVQGGGIALGRRERDGGEVRYLALPGQTMTIGHHVDYVAEYVLRKPFKVGAWAPNVYVTPDSPVPFECNKNMVPVRPVPNAIGTVWVFEKAGTVIRLVDPAKGTSETCEAQQNGATIEFTADGPVLSGIKRTSEPTHSRGS